MKAFIFLSTILVSFQVFSQKIITVSKDGSSDFKTIQAAFNSIPSPNNKPVTIKIKPGIYKERVIVDSGKNFVTLKGELNEKTYITFNYHDGSLLYSGDTINTANSATFLIYADDFHAENIFFQNNAGLYAGPAVSVRAAGNRISFRRCGFLGFQNLLFLSGGGVKHYFESCYIEGAIDFIFGPATAVFTKCRIHSKRNSSITAAATNPGTPYGFVFFDCSLTTDAGLNNVSLGRPLSPGASVAYINCTMDKHIAAQGWSNSKNPGNEATVRYAEYNSTGPGANAAARVKWSRQLKADEVKKVTIKNILGNWTPK